MLNYHPERILETYYAMRVLKGLTMTFDYQYMINPAYNADRGPISFFSGPAARRVLTLRRPR
jgi:high affinity Mn2+ porin